MADSVVFEFVVSELERATQLARPAARAVVRSVSERGLFDPESVNAGQMRLLVERLLADTLRKLAVEDPERVCRQIHAALVAQALAWDGPESPDEIFGRMIRR
jgi:hypothetical protein